MKGGAPEQHSVGLSLIAPMWKVAKVDGTELSMWSTGATEGRDRLYIRENTRAARGGQLRVAWPVAKSRSDHFHSLYIGVWP